MEAIGAYEVKSSPCFSVLFRPQSVRDLAADTSELVAVTIIAVNGMIVAAAITLHLLSMFTTPLVVLLTILFGPLVGFMVSSLYTRVEMAVGRRLGGKATRVELYRLFAWSFLPVGLAALLYSLIIYTLKQPSATTQLAATIPSLLLFCCAIRNYCANSIFTQQFTRLRGFVSILMSCTLFLVLIAGILGFLSYQMGDCLKSMVTQL